jgi:hypothetical protein
MSVELGLQNRVMRKMKRLDSCVDPTRQKHDMARHCKQRKPPARTFSAEAASFEVIKKVDSLAG